MRTSKQMSKSCKAIVSWLWSDCFFLVGQFGVDFYWNIGLAIKFRSKTSSSGNESFEGLACESGQGQKRGFFVYFWSMTRHEEVGLFE